MIRELTIKHFCYLYNNLRIDKHTIIMDNLIMEKDNITQEKDIHKNHRQRVFDRLQKDGLDSFYDHEILELMLFYTVPRMDTNPIAHRLINEFGSFSAVLGADIKSLQKVQGVSEKTAILINMIPSLMRRYNMDRLEPKSAIDSFEKASKYVKALMMGKSKENFYVLCLDVENKLIKAQKLKEGSATELIVNPRAIVVEATKHDSVGVIIAHNHPRGSAQPSFEDIACTKKIALALGVIGIPILDHIIVSDSDVFSFKREGLILEIMTSVAVKIEGTNGGYK